MASSSSHCCHWRGRRRNSLLYIASAFHKFLVKYFFNENGAYNEFVNLAQSICPLAALSLNMQGNMVNWRYFLPAFEFHLYGDTAYHFSLLPVMGLGNAFKMSAQNGDCRHSWNEIEVETKYNPAFLFVRFTHIF